MYVPSRKTRGLNNQNTQLLQPVRPSNEVAREKIADFRHRLSTGQLDGADEALSPKGPPSRLKLG
ncbi:MAG: hypothetical protein JWM80_6006 [Cyanobacteria bacterium RYN_339]|nr:hypothetical protein [Cyanobacteria bacterium RYN_339]